MTLLVFSLVLITAVFHAAWNFAAKRAAGNFYAVYIGLAAVSVVFSPILLVLSPTELFRIKAVPYIIASGVIHAIYFSLLGKAYKHGDISTSYPIARGSGVAETALTAFFVLQEKISVTGAAGILAISTGTILTGLCQPVHPKRMKGLVYALLTGVSIMGYSIVDKLGVGTISPVAYIYELYFVAALCLTPIALFNKTNRGELVDAWKNYRNHGFIIGIGSLLTYLIILFVFRLAPVSYVVALRELAVAVGAIFGIKFLGEKCPPLKIAGIVLIVAGIIVIKLA
ncbi:MAG: EamA family transporter [Elusimicrobiota bacterium]